MRRLLNAVLLYLLSVGICDDINAAELEIKRLKTNKGTEFGVLSKVNQKKPAPTLIVLATTIEDTLGSSYYRHCGNQLLELGYVCVSINLPSHGNEQIAGEPEGLPGWNYRLSQGSNFVAEFNENISSVIDYLIKKRISVPEDIVICGTSRGGFLALHAAIHDRRIKCVAAFAPVTDLSVLREFNSDRECELIKEINLLKFTKELSRRKIWIVIGDRDKRVGTDEVIKLAREISRESDLLDNNSGKVELHVLHEPRGHTVPKQAAKMAADWIVSELNNEG